MMCASLLLLALAPAASLTTPSAVFHRLPPGAVQPTSWLRLQLEKQRDGLTGHAESLYGDIGQSNWLLCKTGGVESLSWERGPYYAKGLVALALTLDDATLKAKAKRWVDALIASQRPDGDFGPKPNNWWANMLALDIVWDWQAATGDARVVPFLRRYFAYQLATLPTHPLKADSGTWTPPRGGDEINVLLSYHAATGDADALRLAALVSSQTTDWETFYRQSGGVPGYLTHIVNFMQGLKTPALRWLLTGRSECRDSYRMLFAEDGWAMRNFGRADRMLNGTEPLSNNQPSEGTEICAIVERIQSCAAVVAATGETMAADDLESVAYNALAAGMPADWKGCRYYTLENQVCCTAAKTGFECPSNYRTLEPSPDPGYPCCRSNCHNGWPRFAMNLWMGTPDGGLATVAYGPCTVTTKAGVRIEESGDYPFGENVKLVFKTPVQAFPLQVRIPGWCEQAEVTVNGKTVGGSAPAGTFRTLMRDWLAGDTVELRFPMAVRTSFGYRDSVCVKRGPLVYGFAPAVNEKVVGTRTADGVAFPTRDLSAKNAWNYALLLAEDRSLAATVETGGAGDPFAPGNAFAHLRVKAFTTEAGFWGRLRNMHAARPYDPPASPLACVAKTVREIELVPVGGTELRVTWFPWAPTP